VDTSKPIVGVVMTMLDLYRKTDADRPGVLGGHWKAVMADLFADAADLQFTGVSHTADEVAGAVSACEQAACDLLLVLPLAYAPSGAAVQALLKTELPLLVVSTARDATLPYAMDDDHIMANHAVHGVQDLANVLARERREFELVAGHASQPQFRDRILGAARAAAATRMFRVGTVGRIGRPFAGMLDFDPGPGFPDVFGMTVADIDPRELVAAAGRVAPITTSRRSGPMTTSPRSGGERVAEFARWAETEFELDDDLTPEILETSARWSLGLEDLVETMHLDAVSMNFLEVAAGGAETMPFLGASRLMARGVGYAGEGDILTAALVTAVAWLAGEATFTEMFCPDYERAEVLLSHMGECNFAMANPGRPVRLVAKEFAFGDCTPPAVPVFQLRPGPVTLTCLTQWPGEGFRLIACTGEVIEAPDHVNLSSPYTRIGFGRDLVPFLEAYSRAGGTHHLALAYGDRLDALRTLARFSGFGFKVV